MHAALKQYIEAYSSTLVSAEEYELIKSVFVPRRLRKGHFFLEQGDVCQFTGFILSGAMRQYSVDARGVEHVVALAIENWWVGDRESFYQGTPSIYSIDAVESTTLLAFTHQSFRHLLDKAPAFSRMVTALDQRNAIASQKRLHSTISEPAEQRYRHLVETHPHFMGRFPKYMLASYLGISPETLSRISKAGAASA